MNELPKKILILADDDGDDRELFCEAISISNPKVITYCTENGKQLIETLTNLKELPHLIFLDINMPVMDGWECLKILKSDDIYSKIATMIYSTSSRKHDIDKALSIGAACFIIKPTDFEDLSYVLSLFVYNYDNDFRNIILKLSDRQKQFVVCR